MQVGQKSRVRTDYFMLQFWMGNFRPTSVGFERNGNAGVSLPTKVEVLDAPALRTRGELTASEEALRFGWASWAIHGLFRKLTDCGDAS
jgi:hypothetical protein